MNGQLGYLKTFVGKRDNVSLQKNLAKKCELAKKSTRVMVDKRSE